MDTAFTLTTGPAYPGPYLARVSEAGMDSALDSGREAWKRSKGQHAGYLYSAIRASVFGFGRITSIEVRGGVPASRVERSYTTGEAGMRLEETFREQGPAVNGHAGGFRAVPLDSLYARCREILDSSRGSGREDIRYLGRFAATGLLSQCGYVPRDCADDCFTGFELGSFEWED